MSFTVEEYKCPKHITYFEKETARDRAIKAYNDPLKVAEAATAMHLPLDLNIHMIAINDIQSQIDHLQEKLLVQYKIMKWQLEKQITQLKEEVK